MKLEKVTEKSGRRYHDACGTAHGLDLVGERWALLVMRELMMGPRRFGDLKKDLCGVSANVLTQRLEGLEASGIVQRRKLPPPASVQVYELTEWGYEAHPVFAVLGRWAARSPHHDPTLPISAVSTMMSLETMMSAEKAGNAVARIGFVFGDESFAAHIADGALRARRESVEGAAVVFTAPPAVVAAAVYGDQPVSVFEGESLLRIDGDRRTAEWFIDLFALPEKAEIPGR